MFDDFEPEEMDREYTPELQNYGSPVYYFGNMTAWYSTAFGYWVTHRTNGLSLETVEVCYGETLVNLN